MLPVPIPAATIELRDARSGTARHVTLRPFRIGQTQVTQGDWAAVASGDPGQPAESTGAAHREPEIPVHAVTWFDAVQWCNAASVASGIAPAYRIRGREVTWDVSSDGFRLPTEAEWEWCWDYADTARYADYRSLRGGGWMVGRG